MNFLKIIEKAMLILGWFLICLFALSLCFAFLYCPPPSMCKGEPGGGDIYFYPFLASFTVLPVGALIILFGKKIKNRRQNPDNQKPLKKIIEDLILGILLFGIGMLLLTLWVLKNGL